MKTVPLVAIVLLAGLAAGGGAAFATSMLMGDGAAASAADKADLPSFVATGKILAPLVFADGRLAGYVNVQAQLQVAPDQVEFVSARLPALLHAINMRTYRAPMASGPDGMLPDIAGFRAVIMAASDEALGKGIVSQAAITEAAPA